MSVSSLRVTGYLSLNGVQYPFDQTLTIGQTVNFNNASCAYHLSLTTNGGGQATPELWVDSFVGANLPMYGEVIVNPPSGFTGATISNRSSTANTNAAADWYYDGTKGTGGMQLAAPWGFSSFALSNSGAYPTKSFGLGVTNSSGFTAPALFLGYGANFTLPAPVSSNESISVTTNSSNNGLTPAITQGGIPVAPDSLAIVAQPLHGTVTVSGGSMFYTPNASYTGADSFTYTSTVGGQVSNTATVTINVALATFTCDQTVLEVWQPPANAYNLRIRAYALSPEFGANDTDVTQVDSRLVFLMALANAKAHYRQPDAQQIAGQLQVRLRKLRARMHNDTRYTVGPKWRPPPMPIILGPDNT